MKRPSSRWKMWKPRGKGQLAFLVVSPVLFLIALYYALFSDKSSGVGVTSDIHEANFNEALQGLNSWLYTVNRPSTDVGIKDQEDLFVDGDKKKVAVFRGEKVVHLDLKGAPPKADYLLQLFPLIKSAGGTGLLIEYEDMFPYSDPELTAHNKYSEKDIVSILDGAAENKLIVIPLVQVFGHMEFVLKSQKFKHLREVEQNPQAICPSFNESKALLMSMIDDVIKLHPLSSYIHIGCDEVYSLAECPRCTSRLQSEKWSKKQLFLDHVTFVARYIKDKYPHMTVLSWDDEFRQMTLEELSSSNIGELIQPVVWKYTSNIRHYLDADLWKKYATVFKKVWIASAFKGADSANSVVVQSRQYLANHESWMDIVNSYSQEVNFVGIMLTGWQRYDHFAVLCELLPAAIPSLMMNLIYLSAGEGSLNSLANQVRKRLKCNLFPVLTTEIRSEITCSFPGSDVFEITLRHPQFVEQFHDITSDSHFIGWLSSYNVENKFSSPHNVNFVIKRVKFLMVVIDEFERAITRAMEDVYDNYTISEWVAIHVKPYKNRLNEIYSNSKMLLEKDVWPRRPLSVHVV